MTMLREQAALSQASRRTLLGAVMRGFGRWSEVSAAVVTLASAVAARHHLRHDPASGFHVWVGTS